MDSDSGSVNVTSTPICGNSIVEAGETCDPPASCPTTCDDGDVCDPATDNDCTYPSAKKGGCGCQTTDPTSLPLVLSLLLLGLWIRRRRC